MASPALELLDAKTLDRLLKFNESQRNPMEALRNNFQTGQALLGAREDGGFYAPAARQLRRQYAWHPVVQHNRPETSRELLAAGEQLLALIRTRRDISRVPAPAARATPHRRRRASRPGA